MTGICDDPLLFHLSHGEVVEFKDYETALACYRSPDYQAAKAIRNAFAEADFIIVEGATA